MGLLDQFTQFAKTPEGQGLLSAAFGGLATAQRGAPLNSIGRAGMAGLAGYSGAIDREQQQADNAFQQQFKQAQLDDLKRKQGESEKRDQFLQNLFNPGGAALAAGAQSGDVSPTKTNAARMDSAPQALGGIPAQALQADILLNGGKNLPEWMFKRGTPDMQVSGGFAFDKNSVKPGYIPQMSVSNDGKATQVVIGPDGSPMVVAPRGAVETYGAFRGVDEGTKANFDPMPITTPDGRTTMTTRRAVVESARPKPGGNYQGSGYAGGSSAAAASDQRAILLRERESAAKAGRAQDVAALDRELARLPGGQAVPGIQVQSEADKVAAVEGAKNAAANTQAVQKDRQTARKFLNQAKFAEDLLKKDPTGSGVGAIRDNVLGFFGQSTPASETAKQLEAVSGWLVSNVPRMEGPQSNFDVDNYMRMAGAVGDKTRPVSERLAALRTIQTMMTGIIDPASPAAPANGKASAMSSGGWSATVKK